MQTGPTLASILAPELVGGRYLGSLLSGAWFSGNVSSTEQLISTGDINPNKLAKDIAILGALGGTGKVVIDVGGKGVSDIFGKGVTESTVGSSNELTTGNNTNSWSMIIDAEAGASNIIYYGRVQSRINLPVGDGKAGWEHVMNRHFSGKENTSQFSISQ